MKQTLTFLLLMTPILLWSQKYTISGSVKDADNGEDLMGAVIFVKEKPTVGAATNDYGFYSISLEKGTYTLIYQYVGYTSIEKKIDLQQSNTINIQLEPVKQTNVVIAAKKETDAISNTEMSVTRLDPKSIETVPVLLGEKDIIKVLQMTPGVKSAGEGNAGFYVRGGAADQNLILLDEAPVYSASHLLGFFSVFNSDALKDVTLYKGGIPAEYGGRGSSVMDVKMKDGNSKHFGASGGIGLISSRLTLEAPIVKDKGSFIVSGRRSYADLFLKLSSDENLNKTSLYFYDLNLKANYQINEKNRVFLSGYFGRDNFNLADFFGFGWGNTTGTLRWNHIFSDKLFSNTSLIYSDYSYNFDIGTGENAFGLTAGIQDLNFKQDFSYFMNDKNTIKFGLNSIYHTFKPGELTAENESFNPIVLQNRYALESGLYVQNDQKINSKVSIHYGLRLSMFNQFGPGDVSVYDANHNVTSLTTYSKGDVIKTYTGLEPRFSVKYQLNDSLSLKGSYNRNYQYLHLLSNTVSSSPTDIWVPSSVNVKPQIIDQVALGLFRNFKENMFETSLEIYYKNLQNQIDYKDGSNLVLNDAIEGELVYGRGKAYGAEVSIRKTKGRFTGWISYTLSRSLRQFDAINNGDWYAARQDRIHDVAIVAMYKITEKLALSANWIYYTGSAVTFPSGKYDVDGIAVPYYTERNAYRMPDYHRLDVGLTWYNKKTDKFESDWNFSIYNAYSRKNAFAITFEENKDTQKTEAIQTTLFQIVPSITYNFKF